MHPSDKDARVKYKACEKVTVQFPFNLIMELSAISNFKFQIEICVYLTI